MGIEELFAVGIAHRRLMPAGYNCLQEEVPFWRRRHRCSGEQLRGYWD